ncbi:MAG: hypothetical protein R3335_00370 [Anaerolineales bacterium]|nr:hypothetical protein [Anaerolineales bacterium]
MKDSLQKLFSIPFHPFLWAAYPVIALLAVNADQVRAGQGLRSLLVSLLLTLILYALLRLLMGDWERAAIVAALAVVSFFAYGHLYQSVGALGDAGYALARHRYFIPVWILLLLLTFLWVRRRLKDPAPFTLALNAAALLLLIFPLFRILSFESQFQAASSGPQAAATGDCGLLVPPGEQPPDVYYIILDAYARADVLQDTYDFHNQPFLDALEARGFFVADRSQSNYAHTELSLSSSLNMDYLVNLGVDYGPESEERTALWPLLRQGAVRRAFECLGYQVVTLDSGYHWTGWDDGDVYLSPLQGGAAQLQASRDINAFESMVINTSAGLILSDMGSLVPAALEASLDAPYQAHRQRILYALDAGKNVVPSLDGPKFVFMHLLVPHSPYVFGPAGEELAASGAFTLVAPPEKEGYVMQVEFINAQMLELVDAILEDSENPAVIVIQGDHGQGSGARDKMSILNAYHLPAGGEAAVYESISPVNTFRVIFNRYFDGNYPLLEDLSYYSPPDALYRFELYPAPGPQ